MRYLVGENFEEREVTWVVDDRGRFVNLKKGDVVEHADLEDGSERSRLIKIHLAEGRFRPIDEAAPSGA